ncbi:MAG: carboxypeptidase-like regulatory domain-containing protein [Bacteroidota bacterium]
MEYQQPRLDLSQLPRCEQNWYQMERIEGGRLCPDCQKCIVDFRGMGAAAIARVHAFSKEPVCGFYTQAQLRNGKESETPRTWRKWLIPALMFSSFWIKPTTLTAQQPTTVPTEQHPFLIPPTPTKERIPDQAHHKVDSILVTGKVIDDISGEPLIGAVVLLDTFEIGTITDFAGNYQLRVPTELAGETLRIGVSYIGYASQQIDWKVPTEGTADPISPAQLAEIALDGSLAVISFGVYVAPWPRRAWGRVTAPFRRFWSFVFRR